MTAQHQNQNVRRPPRSARFAGRHAVLVSTVMWCPPLLVVVGLAFGHLPITHPLWLSWWSLALIVVCGWMSSLFTTWYVDVEPYIPPFDVPHLPDCLSLSVVGGLAALLTGIIATSLDNQMTGNLAANPVYRFALLLGSTSAGVSVGMSERVRVAQPTTYSFAIGAALGLLFSNSIGFFVFVTLIQIAGIVRFSILFHDKRQFLKREATIGKTWYYRLTWLMVWLILILIPAAYIHLMALCLFGLGHW